MRLQEEVEVEKVPAELDAERVDEKLLLLMEQLELLEEKRSAVNQLIEQGWFSISRARYSMGNKQVSALQFGSKMEPLVHLHVRAQDNGGVEFSAERLTHTREAEKEPRPVEDVGPLEDGVRRRTKGQRSTSEKEESRDAVSEKVPPQQEPLRWFGVLVPQSLKDAQSLFKQVIHLSAELATLQTSVLHTREELRNSLRVKHTDTAGGDSSARHDNDGTTLKTHCVKAQRTESSDLGAGSCDLTAFPGHAI